MSVTRLKVAEAPPAKAEVVEVLERALARAKAGSLIAVGIIEIGANGSINTLARGQHRHELIAGCFYLQHDIARDDDAS